MKSRNNKLNFDFERQRTIDEKIDTLTESGTVSDYETWTTMQKRIINRKNLTYGELESRLKQIFKVIKPEKIMLEPDEKKFKKIKEKLLGKHNVNESKLSQYLTGKTDLIAACMYIRERLENVISN